VQFVNYSHCVNLRFVPYTTVIISRDAVLGSSVWFFSESLWYS